MINKYSNVPLYSQLKDLIIHRIETGEYPEDSQIPSEQELCDLYNISRPTVRQAISELTASGYLYKEKGKGTFVSKSKSKIDIKNYSGFTDSILDNDMPGLKDIISMDVIMSSDNSKLAEIFNVGYNQRVDFARIEYLTLKNGSVLSKSTSFIPMNLFPNIIEDVKNKKPSYDILRGKYPLLPVKTKSSLEIIFTGQADAQFLQIQQGQPLICIENILYSKSGQAVEYIVSKYRSDKSKLFFENAKQ